MMNGNPSHYRDEDASKRNAQADADQCDTPNLRPMTTAEASTYHLSRLISETTMQKEKAERVLDILTRHPELHEFLEVLRSGLV